jgi:hypothetical protein
VTGPTQLGVEFSNLPAVVLDAYRKTIAKIG